ncbi:MAG TPA: ABC transporter permease subunit [Firmicutes bacterium]|nr:ABC transporter permease subunit [Bacillota bacterium]
MANKPSEHNFWASRKRQDAATSLILYIIAWAGALIFVIPLVWMVTTSLKTPTEVFTMPPKWIPISAVTVDYPTSIVSHEDGYVRFERIGERRIVNLLRVRGSKNPDDFLKTYNIPEVASVTVTDNQRIKGGDEIAKIPRSGTVDIIENFDKSRTFRVLDRRDRVIYQVPIPAGTNMKVKTGDVVQVGERVGTIPPQWRNYAEAWAPKALNETFNRYLLNTIFITVMGIIGVLFSSSFVAYGFARFKFPGRDPLFLVMISTMMIPVQVTMIPTFILFKYLGWIDTFAPLIVPTFFGGGAFNIFLMRQFFMTIPYELDDAAKIDGCNYFQIFAIILMPLVKPALATIAIFGFVYNWNDFLNPLIYLNSSSNYTLALGLQVFTTMYGSYYHLMMAASTIVLLPILIVFFLGQRYFIEGVATSGLKG